MRRPRIACFSFTSCEGCQLQILNLEDGLLTLAGHADIVNFREAIDEKAHEFDIAFVEGSITRAEEASEVEDIRAKAQWVVAIGACATLGGINVLKDGHGLETIRRAVYGEMGEHFETGPTRRIADVIPVDYEMHGCPIDRDEFIRVVARLLLGIIPAMPSEPVCAECKRRNNACLYELGRVCLGPVTRAGCNAICPTYGESCNGCRGLVPEPDVASMRETMLLHGLSMTEVRQRFGLYNALAMTEYAAAFEV